jgi:hypothetical protein
VFTASPSLPNGYGSMSTQHGRRVLSAGALTPSGDVVSPIAAAHFGGAAIAGGAAVPAASPSVRTTKAGRSERRRVGTAGT